MRQSTCEQCGAVFMSPRIARYCSATCARRAYYLLHREAIILRASTWNKGNAKARNKLARDRRTQQAACEWCHDTFSSQRSSRFCSSRCRSAKAYRQRSPRAGARATLCYGCGREFISKRSDARWCSEACSSVLRNETRRAARLAVAFVTFDSAQLRARFALFPGCWMCGRSDQPLHMDHVKPVSKGGPHMLANLRPACVSCNSRKRDRWFGVDNLDKFTSVKGAS